MSKRKPNPRLKKLEEDALDGPRKPWYSYVFRTITRDAVLFVVGVCLIINEAVLHPGPPRIELLILYGGMCGLPVILRANESQRNNGGGD